MTKDTYGEHLILDTGNLFCPRSLPADDQREAFEAKAKLYIKAYKKHGCDALGFGGNDLKALGIDFARALEKEAGFPFITTNILDADGKPIFKPGTIVERAGVKFGILGLSDPKTPLPDGFTVSPPADAAKAGVETLKAQGAQVILVMTNLGKPDVQNLARAVPGIDFILGDKQMSIPRYVESKDNSLFVGSGQKGKYINVITLNITDLAKRPIVVRDMGQKFLKELQQLDSRLKRYAKLANGPARPGTRASNPDRYKSIIERQLKDRAAILKKVKALRQVDVDSPFITFESVAMDKNRKVNLEVQGWVDAYNKKHPKPKRVRPKGAANRRIKPVKGVRGTKTAVKPKATPGTIVRPNAVARPTN